MSRTLFEPIAPPERRNTLFEQIRTSPTAVPARWMFDDIYQAFTDPDGNFLEQFQTTGFNARCFELYLFAYFTRSGFTVDRSQPNPDFLVSLGDRTVAVEATTVNPSTSSVLAKQGRRISDLRADELREYQLNELPIRFGGPLFSKLRARYWELAHCQGLPLVLAIEAFHDDEALGMTDNALANYAFGLRQTGAWDADAKVRLETTSLEGHAVGEKTIPSNFFGQPDTEHISAILFTNSGTYAKFLRMGYEHGVGNDTLQMMRFGYCFNPDVDALDPTLFAYNIDEPPLVETWGQGLVVFHNPRALHPIPDDFFYDAVQCRLQDGAPRFVYRGWHPFASKTMTVHLGDAKRMLLEKLPRQPRVAVHAIKREEFRTLTGYVTPPEHPIIDEQGWFADETGSFAGVVTRDKVDDDWGYAVLARDKDFQFRAIENAVSVATRDEARMRLQAEIADRLRSGQRIFDQGH